MLIALRRTEVNRLGIEEAWEFNEWCHGRTRRPMGYAHQAWSAGMYVFAYHCVQQGEAPLLTERLLESVSGTPPGALNHDRSE